jgi:gas vesicle protein
MARNSNGANVAGAAILGMLVGGVMGAVAGLLLAPASGRETRRRIADTGVDARNRTLDFIDESRERMADLMDESRSRVADLVKDGKEEIAEAASGIRGIIDEGKQAYRSRRSELVTEGDEESETVPQTAATDEAATT